MAKAKTSISRRTMFSSALAAGAALAIPAAALAQAETLTDNDMSELQKPLAMLGDALAEGRINTKWSKSKTGQTKSVFTIRLNGSEGAELFGAILAGVIFAGHCTADEMISKLEKNIASKTA